MNLTILSLTCSKSTNLSPYFSPSGFFSMSKSFFKQHFSSILYSRNSFAIKKTIFSETLNSAIILDNGYSTKNELFKSTLNLKSENDYSISSCDFYKCSSSGTGGAINFKNVDQSSTFTIQKSGFYQCSADSAACFDANVKSFTIQDSCICGCKASTKTPVFAVKSSTAKLSNLYVEQNDGPYALNIDTSTLEFTYFNATANKDTSGSFLQLTADTANSLNSFSFESNDILNTLFYLKCKDCSAQFLNFYRNFPRYTIELGNTAKFYNCYFIEERSKVIINANTYSCRVQDSGFSGTKEEISTYFPTGGLADITPGVTATTAINQSPSSECWLLLPYDAGSIVSNNVAYKVFFVLAIVILLAAIIFFFCRFSRRKYGLSTDKLAYTL